MATRWGIVSAGKISHDFVTVLNSLPKVEHQIVAVAARDLKNAKDFASLHKIPKAYGSYAELAKDKDVEIAYIGAINTQHFCLGKMMLEAGKHVLLEKPIATNLKQTQQLIKLAEEKKLFLMEAVWSRFFPAYAQLREDVRKGVIGEIVHAQATFGFAGLGVDRVMKKTLGGGAILDIGVYALNAITTAFSGEKPLKVAAVGHTNEYGVDVSVSASLLYSNDRTATISISSVAELPSELLVIGTKGQIKIPKPMWCPTRIITPERTYDFPLPDASLPFNFTNSSGLRYEAMAVRDCLKKGLTESPIMKHKDSEILIGIMDEMRRQIGVVYPED